MNKNFKGFYTKNKKILVPVLIIFFLILGWLVLRALIGFTGIKTLNEIGREESWIPESNNYPSYAYDDKLVIDPKKLLGEDNELSYTDIENLSIDFLESPVSIEGKFDFSKLLKEGRDPYIAYKTGVVKQGVARTVADGSEVSLTGYSSGYITDPIARILYSENEDIIYVLEIDNSFSNYEKLNSDVFFVRNYSSGVFSNFIFEDGSVFKSDNNHEYENLSLFVNWQEDSLKIVDTVIGHNIYTDVENEAELFYVKNKDDIYSVLRYRLPFGSKLFDSSWELKINNFTAGYDYYDICTYRTDISELSFASLEEVGTMSNGDPIYQEKEREGIRDLYEYYIDTHKYENNSIIEDDITPYTFEQFEKSYPVLYWLSPFGKFITLTRDDFQYIYGCGP